MHRARSRAAHRVTRKQSLGTLRGQRPLITSQRNRAVAAVEACEPFGRRDFWAFGNEATLEPGRAFEHGQAHPRIAADRYVADGEAARNHQLIEGAACGAAGKVNRRGATEFGDDVGNVDAAAAGFDLSRWCGFSGLAGMISSGQRRRSPDSASG